LPKYIKHFAKPLLEDLIAGRWLPVIGAGMSRNAVVPQGKSMPLWDDLGRTVASELSDYPYSHAIDALSAYSHAFGRPRLVEKLTEALMINEARPGEVHRAFCSMFFPIVCTTNLDFLLERQYELTQRYCRPVLDEDQLVVNDHQGSTLLLKLHGDVHHPTRMVITEEDYDCFLDRYPLLATYLANLLITRTAVLIGYSLDDPDFRQVWQMISDRLGRARKPAYAILVDAHPTDIARFDRRGVKVIALPGSRSRYAEILSAVFNELREYTRDNLISASHITNEEPLSELSLPKDSVTRLCFFAIPLDLQPLYREQIFPIAETAGLVPVTAADVIGPGENFAAKIDAIVGRSHAAVVDASSQSAMWELGLIRAVDRQIATLVIAEEGTEPPFTAEGIETIRRSRRPFLEQEGFLNAVKVWFQRVAGEAAPELEDEPERLLRGRQYRAAVISAMTYLEATLRQRMELSYERGSSAVGLGRVTREAAGRGLLLENELSKVREWTRVRNAAVHTQDPVSKSVATEIVEGVTVIIQRLRNM
jgi:hypothetical protein